MIRKLVKVAVGLIVLVIAALVIALLSIDTIAKRAVERAGTYVLGTETSVRQISIGIVTQSASMSMLDVANPDGFADPTFLGLGSGDIAVDARSLMHDVVRIPSIRLNDLRLVLEQKGDQSNAAVILANMRRTVGSSGGGSGGSEGRRFIIDELLIDDIAITARSSGLPLVTPTVELKVKQVRLQSLGSGGKDPIGLDQLTAIVVNAVMQAAIEAGASQLPKELMQDVLGGIAGLGEGVPDFVLAVDTGSGLKELGNLEQLANRLGVDLGAFAEALGGEGAKGIGDVGKALDDAGKAAGDAIKKGLEGLTK